MSLDPFDGARKVQGECRIKLACYAEPQPLLAVAISCLRRQSYNNKNGLSEFYRVFAVFSAQNALFAKKFQKIFVSLQ